MPQAPNLRSALNPYQGLRYQACVEPATMEEITQFAITQLFNITDTDFTFDAIGVLSGVTETRELQPISATTVSAVIQLCLLAEIKVVRDRFDRNTKSAVNLGGTAVCMFKPVETFDEYAGVVPAANRTGLIALHYVSNNDGISSYLTLELNKK